MIKRIKDNKDAKRLIIYLFLSFGLTFVWFAFALPKGQTWDGMSSEKQSFVTLGMLFPVIAHVLTRWITKEGFSMTGKDSMMLGISFQKKKWIYYLLAALLPWLYMELANLITLLICSEAYDPEYYLVMGIDKKMLPLLPVSSIVAGVIGSFGAFGEEGGWRGYMMPKLMKLMSREKALLLGGIIWGLWHAPITCIGHNFGTDYPGFPYVGILNMCVLCILMGVLLTFITEKSGSVWPAVILHAVNNASPSILSGYINPNKVGRILGTSASWTGMLVSLILVVVVILLLWRIPLSKYSDT